MYERIDVGGQLSVVNHDTFIPPLIVFRTFRYIRFGHDELAVPVLEAVVHGILPAEDERAARLQVRVDMAQCFLQIIRPPQGVYGVHHVEMVHRKPGILLHGGFEQLHCGILFPKYSSRRFDLLRGQVEAPQLTGPLIPHIGQGMSTPAPDIEYGFSVYISKQVKLIFTRGIRPELRQGRPSEKALGRLLPACLIHRQNIYRFHLNTSFPVLLLQTGEHFL